MKEHFPVSGKIKKTLLHWGQVHSLSGFTCGSSSHESPQAPCRHSLAAPSWLCRQEGSHWKPVLGGMKVLPAGSSPRTGKAKPHSREEHKTLRSPEQLTLPSTHLGTLRAVGQGSSLRGNSLPSVRQCGGHYQRARASFSIYMCHLGSLHFPSPVFPAGDSAAVVTMGREEAWVAYDGPLTLLHSE